MIKDYEDGVVIEFKKKKGGRQGFRRGGFGLEDENEVVGHVTDIKTNKFFNGLNIEASDYKCTSGRRYYSHGLMEALHDAFNEHIPVEVSSDHFWLMICQAVSNHEEKTGILGKLYDLPSPKREIEIRADDFVKGSPHNDWTRVFGDFEKGIKQNVPESLYNLISNKKYSTTTPLDQVCFTVCLMDSLKKYFDYSVMTMCQIPKIYLKGQIDDWNTLYANTKSLSQSGLEMGNWFSIILNILQQFIDVFEKKPLDKKFWSSIYNFMDGSGGPTIEGWIVAFFPYVQNGKANWVGRVKEDDWMKYLCRGGWRGIMKPSEIPNGVNTVPFTWKYLGNNFKYNFYAGFLGLEEKKDTNILVPRLGWAVGEQ